MRYRLRGTRKHILYFCVTFVTIILGMQLVASAVWEADAYHTGPGVTIIQLSNDADTDWAVADLKERLSSFITDDPFFQDRVHVIKTDDPYVAMRVNDQIIIYMSHGGPLGIVTGNHLRSWRTMAKIVSESYATIHLFAACSSRNIIRYGQEDSGKKLYTVPGSRPAEVTNVEITTTVMLAFGFDPEQVSEYRESELERAKETVQSGQSVHIMDFEQIILTDIESIDNSYSDTYTDTFRVYRYSEEDIINDIFEFSDLPLDLRQTISYYYGSYLSSSGEPMVNEFLSCYIEYVRNYYYEAEWIVDPESPPEPPPDPDPPPNPKPPRIPIVDSRTFSPVYAKIAVAPSGYWEYGPHIFTGGSYSGTVSLTTVTVSLNATGPTIDAEGITQIDSISLSAIGEKGVYVSTKKVNGVWQDPVVGRNPSRTGGFWGDSTALVDYEYTSDIPSVPYSSSTGLLHTTGDYFYFDSIPSGTDWHGPTFIRTLRSYFRIIDLGSFSANLSLVHENNGLRQSRTCVSLYDENMQIALSLMIIDDSSEQFVYFEGIYYTADGAALLHSSPMFLGDTNGIVTIRLDPKTGLWARTPDGDEGFLSKWSDLDQYRVIKYVAIQSYRYGAESEHDERVYSVGLNYAGSEYTVFHDSCNDMNEFTENPMFNWGTVTDGTIEVPSGSSYMTVTSIASGSGWHGPNYVHFLDRPFRLRQLTEFSITSEIVQGSSSALGTVRVGLFDDNLQCILSFYMGDWSSTNTLGQFINYYYPVTAPNQIQYGDAIYSSHIWTAKLWCERSATGDGSVVFSEIDGVSIGQPWTVEDDQRIVKYIVIRANSYSTNPLVEMRIHDINIESDVKETRLGTVFYDPCADMSNFEYDTSFDWGTVTTGDLIVPSGTTYMKPTNIPSSPTGWHGPNYVHQLEAPIRLKDLTEFSVHGQYIQQGYNMGKTSIGLFDSNGNLVMQIYWGDSWISSRKGYFHVVYYPEGGGGYADSTGYIYSTIDKTGKLWVDDGVVKYEIVGQTSGTLASVANPYRLITHVVILANRASGYTLGDMRIEDIKVTAGAYTGVMNPGEYDGTPRGTTTDEGMTSQEFDQHSDSVECWWTGWWPLLHIRFSKTSPDGPTLTVQMRCGLLPTDFAIEDVSLGSGMAEDPLNDEDRQDRITDSIASSMMMFPEDTWALYAIGILTGYACQLCQSGCWPGFLIAAGLLLTAYALQFLRILVAYTYAVCEMTSDPWTIFFTIVLMGLMSLFGLVILSFAAPIILQKFVLFRIDRLTKWFPESKGVNDWIQDRTDASWLFIFVKLALVACTLFIALYAVGMAIWVS